MASRRKSATPCMIRPNDLVNEDRDDYVDSTIENGSSDFPHGENGTNENTAERDISDPEKPEAGLGPQKKVQGGYECKYCTFSTQNLNEFKEHVDSNHPNVILNPLYLCAVCNFNTKKFDSLTEHNEKCHPGESNFKFKRIKLNSQTILEQTIEGLSCAFTYDPTGPQSRDDFSTLSKSTTAKLSKPKSILVDVQMDKLIPELPKKQITAVNVNGTVIIPDATLKDGLSHIMPSLQRPPNYSLVPKIAVPLNTSKYNASLDGNLTLMTSFNKFPYPTQAELSWLTAASKHPEEQIKVWFTTQRLKQGISWSPEEVEEARKKMFNGTIQPLQTAFTLLPANLTQSTKGSQNIFQTVLGQSSLVLTPIANGSNVVSAPLALTVTNQALKRPLMSPISSHELKRPSIIQTVQNKSASPTHSISSDCKKTPEQMKELMTSYNLCQFPNDDEVYRLIEVTGLSWGEIKKWFSDLRLGNHRAAHHSKENQPQKTVATKFPLLERVKGKSSEQMKMLEECFQKSSFPSQVEIENLAVDTRLSKTEIDGWFTERRALRDNLEQALLNSMNSKKVDRSSINGVHELESQTRASPLPLLTTSVYLETDSKSLALLKEVFSQTQWPSPEEYNQLELQTGLPRTEIVRWFKDNRSALKKGTLDWIEQYESLSTKKQYEQNSLLSTEPVQSVLQRNVKEAKLLKQEDEEQLVERSKLLNQDIVNWVASKLGHNIQDNMKKDQHRLVTVDNGRWIKVSVGAENGRKDSEAQKEVSNFKILNQEHTVSEEIKEGQSIGCCD